MMEPSPRIWLARQRTAGADWRPIAALVVAICVEIAAVSDSLAFGQEVEGASRKLREERLQLDQAFTEKLATLAAKCDELGLSAEAAETRRWQVPRDPERNYLFLPLDSATNRSPEAFDVKHKWRAKFQAIRQEQAAALFKLAERASASGTGDLAFQLLHEVLHEDEDHAEARRILGHKKIPKGWDVPSKQIRSTGATVSHPQFGWKRGAYWRIESQHFRITTNHSAKEGLALAESLEDFHSIWRQLFFDYWSSSEALSSRFRGGNAPLGRNATYSIVLFRNREEYVAALSKLEPQIGISLGYYHDRQRTAYFYSGQDADLTTRFHEVTHQLFKESTDSTPEVGTRGNFWIVEGIAQYMESFQRRGDFATVGGLDADLLQYARARVLTGAFKMPLSELVGLDRKTIQSDARIRILYSHAAGVTHFLMDGDAQRWRRPTMEFLATLYAGEDSRDSLARLAGTTLEQIDDRFREFLVVDDERMGGLAGLGLRKNFCLGHTKVTDRGLVHVAGTERLRWLDLSFLPITDAGWSVFANSPELRQLNLERTELTDNTLESIASLRNLEELDLSGTPITDAGVRRLSALGKLKELWLSDTQLTDAAVPVLAAMKQLELLDVSGTRITPAGLESLRKSLPKARWE